MRCKTMRHNLGNDRLPCSTYPMLSTPSSVYVLCMCNRPCPVLSFKRLADFASPFSGLLGIAPSQRLSRQPCPPIVGGLLSLLPCR